MGGDYGPDITLKGMRIALEKDNDLRFLAYGRQSQADAFLRANRDLSKATEFVHTDHAVAMDEKPSQAVRSGRNVSSMWKAIDAVKKGNADIAISAGNTGALMAMSTLCLRTIATIDRPAIAAIWPTLRGESIVLDVGATVGADAQQLIDFAILGGAMARAALGIEMPSVGLLNIGVEEVKGVEEVRAAGSLLRKMPVPFFSYHGFVEGDDISRGTVDVVVTEGFAGNIALKTAEGTARQIGGYLRDTMQSSLSAKLGYLFARKAFEGLKHKLDPRRANGGMFLGLNGLVMKSHGGTDALGFSYAIDLAAQMVRNGLQQKITEDLERYYHLENLPEKIV